MIDLGQELEEHSRIGAEGASERFADPATRAALRVTIANAKRRANVIILAAGFAIIGVSAGAWAEPRIVPQPAPPSPSASASAVAEAPVGQLPKLDSPNYLTELGGAYRTSDTITCNIIPIAPMVEQAYPYPGSIPPLPSWIEADRIYGLPDLFPPRYPIPLYSRDGSPYFGLANTAIPQLYPKDAEVVVALIAEDGSWWGFDAKFEVVDVMPFDPAGMFVTLTPNPECHGGLRSEDDTHVPPGHYDARVMVNRTDVTYGNVIKDFGDVEIVTGLPSVPSLHVTE